MPRPRLTEDSPLAALNDTTLRCACGNGDDVVRCVRRACGKPVCVDHRRQCNGCEVIHCAGCVERHGWLADDLFFCDACENPEDGE